MTQQPSAQTAESLFEPNKSTLMRNRLTNYYSSMMPSMAQLQFTTVAITYFIIITLLYSISIVDFNVSVGLRANPFSYQLPASAQYLYASILNIFIPHIFGIVESKYTYYAFSALTTIAAFYVLYQYCLQSFSERAARIFCFLCIMSTPIPIILLQYSGSSSAFVIMSFVLLVMSRNEILKFVFALILVLAHKEQGVCLAAGYIFLSFVIDGKALLSRETAAIGAAVLIGVFIHYLYVKSSDFNVVRSRADWIMVYGPSFVRRFLASFPLLTLFSGIGLWTVWKFKYIMDQMEEGRRARVYALLGYFLAASAIASLTTDYTRVAGTLMAPMFLLVTRKLCANIQEIPSNSFLGLGLAGLFSLLHYQVFLYQETIIIQDTAWVRYSWLF